jgi:heme/copper-type cytochrome/quinol oxidase subunit 3
MHQADIAVPAVLRASFAVTAISMFALWGWSLIPPIENWGNPHEDGFSYVGVFWTTLTCLPAGLCLIIGAVVGRGRHAARALKALLFAGVLLLLVVGFIMMQYIDDRGIVQLG